MTGLRCRANSLAETYELVVYFPGTKGAVRLDNLEHQSQSRKFE